MTQKTIVYGNYAVTQEDAAKFYQKAAEIAYKEILAPAGW